MADWDQIWKGKEDQLEAFGKGQEGLFKVAAGMYGGSPEMIDAFKKLTPIMNSMLPSKVKGTVKDEQVDENAIASGEWSEEDFKVGKLDTPEERLKVMNKLTQNVSGDMMSTGSCGTMSLIAAAIHGGGEQGIQAIIDEAKKGMMPGDDEAKSKLKLIQDHLKSGDLSSTDIDTLNGELYYQLRNKQFDEMGGSKAGLDPEMLKKFISGSDKMTEYFKKGDMSIDSVDADQKDGGDHFVLSIGGENGFVYDPTARKDGNQLVFNPVDAKRYHQSEIKGDRIDADDFGGPFKHMY